MDQNWYTWSGNSIRNVQIHRFTMSEYIAKCFREATFLTHPVLIPVVRQQQNAACEFYWMRVDLVP